MDAYGGYTFYRDDREQYLRVGLLLEDLAYESKNDLGGETTQVPVALQWALRLGTGNWWIFSEGKAGNGFKREFNEPTTELLAHYVHQRASAEGFNAHRYSRDEWLGGVFYERLWPRNGLSLAYAFGLPNADYESLIGGNPYQLDEYGDKLILGWRHRFSRAAQLLISISHEVSAQGFGGGNVQFQMFL